MHAKTNAIFILALLHILLRNFYRSKVIDGGGERLLQQIVRSRKSHKDPFGLKSEFSSAGKLRLTHNKLSV